MKLTMENVGQEKYYEFNYQNYPTQDQILALLGHAETEYSSIETPEGWYVLLSNVQIGPVYQMGLFNTRETARLWLAYNKLIACS
jgi:hypothetical protein